MRFGLHPSTHKQQTTLGMGREVLCGQQRHGRCSVGRHRWTIQHMQQTAIARIKHHHFALDGGQSPRGVVWHPCDEFGDGQLRIGGRHDKQTARVRQAMHQTRRHHHRGVQQ